MIRIPFIYTTSNSESNDKAREMDIEKITVDEETFRWMMNEDAMATEKLAEGIRNFTRDLIRLEKQIEKLL